MANNRMFLVCNVCHPERPAEFIVTDKGRGFIHLAKWYPGGMGEEGAPYYRNDNGEGMGKEFIDFLDKHKHGEVASKNYTKGAGQENPVRIEYELEGLPIENGYEDYKKGIYRKMKVKRIST